MDLVAELTDVTIVSSLTLEVEEFKTLIINPGTIPVVVLRYNTVELIVAVLTIFAVV